MCKDIVCVYAVIHMVIECIKSSVSKVIVYLNVYETMVSYTLLNGY